MHRAFARLTAWASAWSGSPAALTAFIGLPLASLAWGWSADWSAAWSGACGAFTGWASLILLVLLRAAQIAQDRQQATDTAAILAMTAELVRAVDRADNRVIPAKTPACERTVLHEDAS